MTSWIQNVLHDAAFDLLKPQHAAWICGRLVHGLDHFMSIAWLTGDIPARADLDAAFGSLGVASRGLLGNEAVRGNLRELVADAEDSWRSQYASAWRAQMIWDTEMQLGFAIQESGESVDELIALHCKELLVSVSELIRSLRNGFAESIDGDLFECFCLAECVGQAVHPVPVYRYMTAPENQSVGEPGWTSVVSRPRREPHWLPELPIRIKELPQSHWDEIALRWRQLELPTELLATPTNTRPTPTSLSRHFASCFVNSRGCRTDRPNEPRSELISDEDAHRLITVNIRADLELTLENHVLRRRGYARHVVFQHPLLCNLMHELLRSRQNCVNHSEIGHRWRQLGATCPTADRVTVRAEFMRLGAMLRPLDLSISGTSDGGWSLSGSSLDSETRAIMAEAQ